jgi:hypothetical protein
MATIDANRLERAARRRYELRRLSDALLAAVPIALIGACAAWFARRPASTVSFAIVTVLAASFLFWWGRAPRRAVLPGVVAGVLPLVLSLTANGMHHCASGQCSSMCVPACVAGGLLAGFGVSTVGLRRRAGWEFWLAGSALALATGSMGCACIGFSGVVGLAAGYAVGLGPGLWRRLAGARA